MALNAALWHYCRLTCVQGRQIETSDLEEMGTLFCVGLLRLEDQLMDDEGKDSMEFLTCHSESR